MNEQALQKTIAEHLANQPFFEGMSEEDITLVAGCAKLSRFDTEAFLLKEGESADRFYLLRRGEVAIEQFTPNGGAQRLITWHRGDMVGYSWLFPPYRYAFDARALSSVSTIEFDGACLRGKAEADHDLGYHLMQRFGQLMLKHMQSARRQMLDVYGEQKAG